MKNSFFLRRKKIQATVGKDHALLIASRSDIFYLTGYQFLVPEEREALLVITQQSCYLIHSGEDKKNDNITYLRPIYYTNLSKQLVQIADKEKIKFITINPFHLFAIELEQISKTKLTILHDKKNFNLSRQIKDDDELMYVKKSCKIAKKAFERVRNNIGEGITEIELQNQLEQYLSQQGVKQTAFPTIVGFGTHTASHHHQPTNRKLKKNMAVLIDFGAKFNHYRSDMTRSFWFGDKKKPLYQKIENTVRHSYQQTIKQIKKKLINSQPLLAKDIDQMARDVITQQGFGKYFNHTTGHGIGIDIHEPPSLNWQNSELIKENMIITIEPGIYLPKKFGFRFENTILIKNNSLQELT